MLRPQVERFLAGEVELQSDEISELATFMGMMRAAPTSERSIEGEHAQTHKHGLGRPHHTAQFMSLHLRSPEFKEAIATRPAELKEVAFLCQVASNPLRAGKAVGLMNHPVLLENQRRCMHRHPIFGRIIYHADGFSLYRAAVPVLNMGGDSDDDGPDLDGLPGGVDCAGHDGGAGGVDGAGHGGQALPALALRAAVAVEVGPVAQALRAAQVVDHLPTVAVPAAHPAVQRAEVAARELEVVARLVMGHLKLGLGPMAPLSTATKGPTI